MICDSWASQLPSPHVPPCSRMKEPHPVSCAVLGQMTGDLTKRGPHVEGATPCRTAQTPQSHGETQVWSLHPSSPLRGLVPVVGWAPTTLSLPSPACGVGRTVCKKVSWGKLHAVRNKHWTSPQFMNFSVPGVRNSHATPCRRRHRSPTLLTVRTCSQSEFIPRQMVTCSSSTDVPLS